MAPLLLPLPLLALVRQRKNSTQAVVSRDLLAARPTDPSPRTDDLRPVAPAAIDAAAVRRWATDKGLRVAPRGRLAADLVRAYSEAHPDH